MSRSDRTADMRLPVFSLIIAVVAMVVGCFCAAINLQKQDYTLIGIGLVLIAVGVLLFFAWKNERLYLMPDDEFEYIDILGRSNVYSFRDVTNAVCSAKGVISLYMGTKRLQFSRDSVQTDALRDRLNALLRK